MSVCAKKHLCLMLFKTIEIVVNVYILQVKLFFKPVSCVPACVISTHSHVAVVSLQKATIESYSFQKILLSTIMVV